MIWNAPKIWPGSQVFILGGGTSLRNSLCVPATVQEAVRSGASPLSVFEPYLRVLQGHRVIAVNTAFKMAQWIDVCFFGDKGWWLKNRKELAAWPGLKITCHPAWANRNMAQSEGIKYLSRDTEKTTGINSDTASVAWNGNSGFAAISLAVHFGATRIALIGFDMKMTGDESHFHADYEKRDRTESFKRHRPCARFIQRDALQRGIEIINTSPNSAIREFKHVPLEELL